MARVDPYNVVIYQNSCNLIQKTEDIKANVEYVVEQLKAIVGSLDFPSMGAPELPVKLIALPESFSQGWPADFPPDLDNVEACKKFYDTTVPGPETDILGEAAKYTGAYIMACMQARDPELMEDQSFNISFIINPEGKVIYKRHKTSLFNRERVCCPTDIWDRYIEKYGGGAKALLDAVFPVVKTDIGNLSTAICGEGDKPEVFRAFAMNGAEVMYRASYIRNLYSQFELQNRSHAHFNNCYVIGPNCPVLYAPGARTPMFPLGTIAHVIDYRGEVIARSEPSGSAETWLGATIDIEQLRYHRFHSLWQTWVPHLRVEEYILPYQYALDMGGLYPKNLGMDGLLLKQRPHDDVIRWCVNRAVELGIWTPPDGWEPFKIPQDILDKIERAKARPKI